MAKKNMLNLLMIDDNQLDAEALVTLLKKYYDTVNLGFLDDKEELIKLLRQPWDVLIFGNGYDIEFADVIGLVQDYELDLPLICLTKASGSASCDEIGLPSVINSGVIKALPADNRAQIVISTCVLHSALMTRRELTGIKNILAEAEQRADILIKNSKSAVAYIDQGIHIFTNQPYVDMFGFTNPDDLIGVPIIDLIAGGDNIKGFKQFLRRFDKGNREQVEFKFNSKRKDGSTFEAKLQLAAATLKGAPVTQVIIQPDNQANAAELQQKMAEIERRDNLTGLLNRLGFEEHLAQITKQARNGEMQAALLYIRVDEIGKINSTLGIQGVDATIRQVGQMLDTAFSESEVSRFSDNTFTVLMTDINNKEAVKAKVATIQEQVAKLLIEVDTRTVTTTVTIGGVFIDSTSPEATKLVNRATEMASQAYTEGDNTGNSIKFYDASQHATSDNTALAEYLQTALAQSKFKLQYQPIYDIETDSSEFYEVYVGLPLTDGTVMKPEQFLPVATEYGLVDKIDRWVLINACKQLSKVRETVPEAQIMVPLTSASLSNDKIAGFIGKLVNAVGGSTPSLTVQFTEQTLVDHMAIAKKQFDDIKAQACQVSIKNFGETTKTIDLVDYLVPCMARLARNYVNDLNNEDNMRVIKTLVSQANERGTPVLMPYIEDAATMTMAWNVGARYLQGNYLQEPSDNMQVAEGS